MKTIHRIICWLLNFLKAPYGFEDESGFHYGKETNANKVAAAGRMGTDQMPAEQP